ncbi:hypothetical protein U1Q18_026657 [Sarracenia purpurea var. burkii]
MGSSGFGRKWGVLGLGKRDDENRVVGWFIVMENGLRFAAGYWKLGLLEKGLREADDRGGAQRGTAQWGGSVAQWWWLVVLHRERSGDAVLDSGVVNSVQDGELRARLDQRREEPNRIRRKVLPSSTRCEGSAAKDRVKGEVAPASGVEAIDHFGNTECGGG